MRRKKSVPFYFFPSINETLTSNKKNVHYDNRFVLSENGESIIIGSHVSFHFFCSFEHLTTLSLLLCNKTFGLEMSLCLEALFKVRKEKKSRRDKKFPPTSSRSVYHVGKLEKGQVTLGISMSLTS